jgi:hypothetical protein
MDPKKFTINFLIEIKCKKCTDISFCKLYEYYKNVEKPTIKNINNLTNCLYYKKDLVSKKIENVIN